MANIQMVCPRNYTLRSRLGHTIAFEAGVPKPVPEALYAEALSKNIIPVAVPDNEKPAFEMAHAEITGTLRDALIFRTLSELHAQNQSENFTGGGVPKAAVVSAAIGIAVSASEVGKYWQTYRQLLAENEPLPTHPQMDLVVELQGLSTRKQLEEFAAEIELPLPATKGKSLKELKSLLLYSVVHQQAMAPAPDTSEYVKPNSLTMD